MNFRELFASLAIALFRHKHYFLSWKIIKSYSAVSLKTINKADPLTGQSTFLLVIPLPGKAFKMYGLPLDHFTPEP